MIREIQKEQATSEAKFESMIRGFQRPKMSQEQQVREAGLNTIMQNDFIRAIAHKLHL